MRVPCLAHGMSPGRAPTVQVMAFVPQDGHMMDRTHEWKAGRHSVLHVIHSSTGRMPYIPALKDGVLRLIR